MDRKIVFISYWTSHYKKAAERLRASLDRLGLEHDIQEIQDNGWTANVRYKPTHILSMLYKHSDAYAVVWIDADGDVLQTPTLFFEMEEDLGAHFYFWKGKQREELLSGTLFVRNTPNMIAAMEQWVNAMKKAPMNLLTPEQQTLHAMLDDLDITYRKLPVEYCQILGRDAGRRGVDKAAIIVHYQFSRSTRKGLAPAAHLSGDTKIGKGPRAIKPTPDLANVREKKRRRLPEPKRAVAPKDKTRIPAAVKTSLRRKEIYALRKKNNKQMIEEARTQKAILMAAGVRNRKIKLYAKGIVDPELAAMRKEAFGGVKGYKTTQAQNAYAKSRIAQMDKAEELDGALGQNDLVLVLGNSPTINTVPQEVLNRVPTVSCNRILRWGRYRPDFVVIADREPYCQERDSGRLEAAVDKGTKLLLSDSLFDPDVLLRGPYTEVTRRAQPTPDFQGYLYRLGPRRKTWNYGDIAARRVKLPCNFTTFESPLVTCQNVIGSMLQSAAILGAKTIIVVGVEMRWESDAKSHFFGDGKSVGAYPQDGSIDLILGALKQLKQQAKKAGITIINASPIEDSPFSSVFTATPQKEVWSLVNSHRPFIRTNDAILAKKTVEQEEIAMAIYDAASDTTETTYDASTIVVDNETED